MRIDDIIPLLPSAYTQYTKYIATKCVFHNDSNPSFMIYEDGFYCLSASCGKSGSLEYLHKYLSGSKDTLPLLSQRKSNNSLRIPRPKNTEFFLIDAHNYSILHDLDWYWRTRGFTREEVKKYWLGHFNGWNTIPVFDREYETKGYILRASPTIQKIYDVRYIIPYGQSPMMFAPDWSKMRDAEYVIIVYGMIDALALSALGYNVVTTTGNGHKTFSPDWLKDLRVPKIIIPDKGEELAGLTLARDIGLWARMVRMQYEDDQKDCADLFRSNRENLKEQIDEHLLGILSGK